MGGIEATKESEDKVAQIINVGGNFNQFQDKVVFNKTAVQQTIINIKQVIEKSAELEGKTKKHLKEHLDNILKDYSKEGTQAVLKAGFDALKDYMVEEGFSKVLNRALKVASGGWLG